MSTYPIRHPPARSPTVRGAGEVAGALLVAAIAAGMTRFVDDRWTLRDFAVVAVAVLTLWLATTRRTQLALALLMVYLGTLDGYLKLATGSGVITFVRDVLLFAIVVGLLVRAQAQRSRLAPPPLTAWVAAFVALVTVQLFNPQAGSLVHSLAGARQHLEFVPLFFLTFAFVRTARALRGFVTLLVLIAAANGVAGWVQFNETPQQLAAWGPGYAERVLGEGAFGLAARTFYASTGGESRTRPFGLGSDAGSGGALGAIALGGAVALMALFRRPRHLLLAVVMAVGVTTAIVTSQGRGVVVSSVVILLAYGALSLRSRGRVASLAGLAVGAVVAFLVVQAIVGTAGSSVLRYQGLSASKIVETTGEARGKSIAQIPNTMAKYPLGAGLGTAGPASVAPGPSALTGVLDAESELSFLTLETGIGGMLLITGFTLTLLVLGISRCRHEPDREARVLLAAIIAPVAGILVLYVPSQVTPAVPVGPYLWAVGGIVSYWLVARPAQRRRDAVGAQTSERPVEPYRAPRRRPSLARPS